MRTTTRSALLLIAILTASTAAAAPVCETKSLPGQGSNATGGLLNTTIVVPANQSTFYPIFYPFPADAVSVGLEFWTHRVPSKTGFPVGGIMFFGYIDRHLPHPPPPFRHDAITTHAFTGVGDNQFKNENLSTVLHPGEAYVVGVYSSVPYPITVDLFVTVRECF